MLQYVGESWLPGIPARDLSTEEVKQFLDLAVANALWDQWKLSKAFHHVTENTELSTPLVAKILTINRCTAPCAHYSIPQWIRKTALEEVVGGSLELLNDYTSLVRAVCTEPQW